MYIETNKLQGYKLDLYSFLIVGVNSDCRYAGSPQPSN